MGELADYLVHNDPNFRKARLPALYSDFRAQRTLNPDGFQANVHAWQHALGKAAWNGRISSRSGTPDLLAVEIDGSLARSLDNKQFGRPLALGTVVREAVETKDLLPLSDFLKARESIYYRSWTELPWHAVTWTLRKIWASDATSGEDKIPNGQFVVVKNVEETAKLLHEAFEVKSSRFERVLSRSHFEKTFAGSLVSGRRLSTRDVDILLIFLSRDKGTILYDGKTVRIKGADDEQSIITEEDTAIASIKELIDDLQHQTGLLSSRVDELAAAAKDAVSRKNKVQAMASLRSKKVAETLLEKRFDTLNQLEQVAAKIQQAADQVALVRAMESSTGVLQGLNSRLGGAERVDEVVSQLREQMVEVDEVGQVLAEAGTNGVAAVDEGEIDDELEALVKEERNKAEAAERVKQEAERVRKESEAAQEAAQEAEVTRRRLEALGETPTGLPLREKSEEDAGRLTPATEAAKELEQMELGETRQPQAAT